MRQNYGRDIRRFPEMLAPARVLYALRSPIEITTPFGHFEQCSSTTRRRRRWREAVLFQIGDPLSDPRFADARGVDHRGDPAVADRMGLARGPQPRCALVHYATQLLVLRPDVRPTHEAMGPRGEPSL